MVWHLELISAVYQAISLGTTSRNASPDSYNQAATPGNRKQLAFPTPRHRLGSCSTSSRSIPPPRQHNQLGSNHPRSSKHSKTQRQAIYRESSAVRSWCRRSSSEPSAVYSVRGNDKLIRPWYLVHRPLSLTLPFQLPYQLLVITNHLIFLPTQSNCFPLIFPCARRSRNRLYPISQHLNNQQVHNNLRPRTQARSIPVSIHFILIGVIGFGLCLLVRGRWGSKGSWSTSIYTTTPLSLGLVRLRSSPLSFVIGMIKSPPLNQATNKMEQKTHLRAKGDRGSTR